MALKKSIISKIHVAKNQLAMDDDSYRMLLKRLTGKTSSKELNEREASRVIAEFRAKGFVEKTSNKRKGEPHNKANMPAMIEKIEALLADMGLPWAYADKIAKQMFKIERIAWVKTEKQLKAIIAALDNRHKALQLRATTDYLIEKLKPTTAEKQQLLANIKGGYKAQINILKKLNQYLIAMLDARGISYE